jgi:hypothetical protein
VSEHKKDDESGTGEETQVERALNRYAGNLIHLFLSLLALIILAAAAVATFDTVVREFPKLWQPATDEYRALQHILENVLLVAIAAELALLLLFHRSSAAVEVIIFVIARKIVSPDLTAVELLLSVTALIGLLIARFYFLPGKPK